MRSTVFVTTQSTKFPLHLAHRSRWRCDKISENNQLNIMKLFSRIFGMITTGSVHLSLSLSIFLAVYHSIFLSFALSLSACVHWRAWIVSVFVRHTTMIASSHWLLLLAIVNIIRYNTASQLLLLLLIVIWAARPNTAWFTWIIRLREQKCDMSTRFRKQCVHSVQWPRFCTDAYVGMSAARINEWSAVVTFDLYI